MLKRKGFKYILVMAAILTVSFFGISNMHAKYVSEDDTHAFSFDMLAKYEITFDANGGELEAGCTNKIAEVGKPYGELPVPTRTGYTFAGWAKDSRLPDGYQEVEYIKSTGTQYINTGYKPTTDTGYEISYSGFTVPTSSVEHILFGAGTGWTNLVGINNSTALPRSNTIPYILYDGVNCSLAQQEAATYYLDKTGFYVNGSSIPTFKGSAKSFDWSSQTNIQYQISIFYLNNSFNNAIKPTAMELRYFRIYEKGELVRDYVPCYCAENGKAGLYDLIGGGFCTNAATSGPDFEVGDFPGVSGDVVNKDTIMDIPDNHTLFARWTPNTYTLTLKYNDGATSDGSLMVTYDDTYAALPMPERVGYTFDGWFCGDTEFENTDTVLITENTLLTAHWTVNKYNVTFDALGGTVDPSSMTVTFDETYGTLPEATRTGYTFEGWSLECLPEGYRELAYIEGTGAQYINTGYKPTDKTAYEISYSGYTVPSLTGPRIEHILFGAGNSWTNMVGINNSTSPTQNNRSNTIPYILYDGVSCSLAQQEAATYYLDKTGFYVNGSKTPEFSAVVSDFDWTEQSGDEYEIAIFRTNKKFDSAIECVPMKLHSFKIWEDGVLVLDLVPCYGTEEAEYGMIDRLSGTFYVNSGEGSFTGPAVSSKVIVDAQTKVTVPFDHTLYAQWKKTPAGME